MIFKTTMMKVAIISLFMVSCGPQNDELGRKRTHHENIFWGQFCQCVLKGCGDARFHDVIRAYPEFINQPIGDRNRIFMPLTAAIVNNQETEAITLIRYGADLKASELIGISILPLHASLNFDNRGLITKYLLVYGAPGADMQCKDTNSASLLILNQWRSNPAVICGEVRRDLDKRVGWFTREYEKAERGKGRTIREFPATCGTK